MTDASNSELSDSFEALADARRRLAEPPDREASALAIDALACLVEGLDDRLGDDASVLRDALANIRLAFVQVKGALEA